MLASLTWTDYGIIGVLALSALVSLLRGFVRETLSLLAWLLSFWVAFTFFREVAVHMPWISVPSIRIAVSFILLLVTTLILGAVVNYLIGQLLDKTGLTFADRMLGMIFGLGRGALIVAVLVLLAGLTPLPQDPWWQESRLLYYFIGLAEWLRSWLPADIAARFHW